MLKNFEICDNTFEQSVADNEAIESRYWELIHMKSRTGFYPTKINWINACSEGRVEGKLLEKSAGDWIMEEIQIKNKQNPNRVDYAFVM